MMTPRAADLDTRDYKAEEAAHREHLTEPVECDGCGDETTRDTIGTSEVDGEVYCPGCSVALCKLVAGETRWGRAAP